MPPDTPVSPIDATASAPGFQAKASSSKTGLSPLGNITISPTQTNELLANMQQMINQRATVDPDRLVFSGGPVHNTIMNSFKDMAAWASGGAKGPTEGLALRDAEKAREAKDLFEMRTKMAEYKAAQDSAKATADRIAANLKPGATGVGGSGAGMTYNGITVPPSVQAQIKDLHPTQQDAYLNKWLETLTTEGVKSSLNPASLDLKDALVFNPKNGEYELKQVNLADYNDLKAKGYIKNASELYEDLPSSTKTSAAATTQTGPVVKGAPVSLDLVSTDPALRRIGAGESSLQNIPNAAGASDAYGVYQIVPKTFELVKSKSPEFKDVTWEQFKADPKIQTAVAEKLLTENDKIMDQRKVEKNDLNRYSVWFSGDTKIATAPADTPIEKVMSAQQIAANKLAGKTVGDVRDMLQANLNRGDKVLASSKTAADISKSKAELRSDLENPQPGVQVASTGKAGLPDIPKMKAEQEAYKEKIKTAAQEAAKTAEIDRKDFKINTNPDTLIETDALSKRVQKLVKEFPEISGVINKADYTSAVAGVLRDGIGPVTVKGIEDALFKTSPTTNKESLAARNELAQYLARMELQAAKLIKGQGQITEGEREILRRASASLDDPAELLYKKARILERANQKNEALAAIYGSGEKFADFEKFSQDPEFRKIMKEYKVDLNNIMSEKVDFKKLKPGVEPSKGAHPPDIQDIIKRNKPKKAE
jgi:hypothetical protein